MAINKQGFSLIEISVVLVVIGLLIGGVVAGKSLLRNSQLRSVATDAANYFTAAGSFREKYDYLPGDLPDATKYWGEASSCNLGHTDRTTCNGDGNSIINGSQMGLGGEHEAYTAWQHLYQSAFIPGPYSGGRESTGVNEVDIGKNVPSSKIKGAGFTWSAYATDVSGTAFAPGDYTNALFFGKAGDPYITWRSALTPQEAWYVDSKVDDGMANQGKIVGVTSSGTLSQCMVDNGNDSMAYKVQGTGDLATSGCALAFLPTF